MQISDFSISNPVKVAVGVILVCLYGLIALYAVPVQLTPSVSKPTITVETYWMGASPEEIEKEIVEKQEAELKSIEGMIDFRSECRDGRGKITLQFRAGTDMSGVLVNVANALQQVREYPEDADKPRIRSVDIDDSPIAWLSLAAIPPTHAEVETVLARHPNLRPVVAPALRSAEVDVPILYRLASEHPELQSLVASRIDTTKLRNFVEDYLESAFERVPGVANCNVYGGQLERMEVEVDPSRLAARGITIPDLRRALAGENTDVSGGDLWEGKRRYAIRTLGKFSSPEQVASVVVAHRDAAPVYVRDVADVRLGYARAAGVVLQNGVPSLALNVQKDDQANVLEVMQGVQTAMRDLNAGLLKSRGLRLTQFYDQTDYITSATGLVRSNIFVGGALAVLVLLLFLRSGRSTLVVALSIPISVIGTFLVMWMLGRSINVISLAGMAFAVGMVVDNAIVVLENIFSHYQRGEPPRVAASRGTSEVWGAVLASTLTTLAVFLPVVFVQEQAGQLFRDIAIAISAGVALSMVVSLTVIPAATSLLLRKQSQAARGADRVEFASRCGARVVAFVVWLTERLQTGRIGSKAMIVCCGLFFVGAVGLVPATNRHFPPWPYLVPVPHLFGLCLAALATVMFVLLASRARRLAVALTLMVLAVGLSYKLMPGAEYLPEGNKNLVMGLLLPPPGYNPDKMIAIGRRIEKHLRPYWETPPGGPEAAKLNGLHIDSFFFVARGQYVFFGRAAPIRPAPPS